MPNPFLMNKLSSNQIIYIPDRQSTFKVISSPYLPASPLCKAYWLRMCVCIVEINAQKENKLTAKERKENESACMLVMQRRNTKRWREELVGEPTLTLPAGVQALKNVRMCSLMTLCLCKDIRRHTRHLYLHQSLSPSLLLLTLKVLNFWKFTSYCSLKPLWSGMGEVVPARTSPTLHPPSPPTVQS